MYPVLSSYISDTSCTFYATRLVYDKQFTKRNRLNLFLLEFLLDDRCLGVIRHADFKSNTHDIKKRVENCSFNHNNNLSVTSDIHFISAEKNDEILQAT